MLGDPLTTAHTHTGLLTLTHTERLLRVLLLKRHSLLRVARRRGFLVVKIREPPCGACPRGFQPRARRPRAVCLVLPRYLRLSV